MRIEEEARRIERLHPMDAKNNCDKLDADLEQSEDQIKSMFTDVGTLKDGRHPQSGELYKRYMKMINHNFLNYYIFVINYPVF